MSIYVYLFIRPLTYLPTYLTVYLPTHPPTHLSTYQPTTYLSIYLPINPPTYLPNQSLISTQPSWRGSPFADGAAAGGAGGGSLRQLRVPGQATLRQLQASILLQEGVSETALE